jgi:hypothetical protein
MSSVLVAGTLFLIVILVGGTLVFLSDLLERVRNF